MQKFTCNIRAEGRGISQTSWNLCVQWFSHLKLEYLQLMEPPFQCPMNLMTRSKCKIRQIFPLSPNTFEIYFSTSFSPLVRNNFNTIHMEPMTFWTIQNRIKENNVFIDLNAPNVTLTLMQNCWKHSSFINFYKTDWLKLRMKKIISLQRRKCHHFGNHRFMCE